MHHNNIKVHQSDLSMERYVLSLIFLAVITYGSSKDSVCSIDIAEQILHQFRVSTFHNDQHYDSRFQTNWMKDLPNEKLIQQLSIPGTHDTGTFRCDYYKPCHIFQCQTLSIYDQLIAGIRYLDLRINSESPLTIGHQEIEFMHFDQVLKDIKRFLEENQSEFLILAFQRNAGNYDPSEQIKKQFEKYKIQAIYEMNSSQLTVGKLRGKVWVFRGLGIDLDSSTFLLEGIAGITNNEVLYLQNFWQISYETVVDKTNFVMETAFSVECSKMKGNFLSGSVGITPFQLAIHKKGPNLNLLNNLMSGQKNCLGITIMDFPQADLIHSIIQSNKFNYT